MVEKLTKLNNTLAQIETKGDSTILIAQCRTYIANLIEEVKMEKQRAEKAKVDQTEGD